MSSSSGTVPMLWLLRPLPATGWRREAQKRGIGRAGVIRAGLPALFPRTPRHNEMSSGSRTSLTYAQRFERHRDHAAYCRLGQAQTWLTEMHSGEEPWAIGYR